MPRFRPLSLALILAGAALLASGVWPRAVENERTFDSETGVVAHAQTAETARAAGLVLGATGLATLALSWQRP